MRNIERPIRFTACLLYLSPAKELRDGPCDRAHGMVHGVADPVSLPVWPIPDSLARGNEKTAADFENRPQQSSGQFEWVQDGSP
jgi:hypothetical protein